MIHARARVAWGLDQGEFDPESLIAEKYRGIRPAHGYPGVPRPHRENARCLTC